MDSISLKNVDFFYLKDGSIIQYWRDHISKPMELLNLGTVKSHCQALATCLLEESNQPHSHSNCRSRQAPHRCSNCAPELSLNSHNKWFSCCFVLQGEILRSCLLTRLSKAVCLVLTSPHCHSICKQTTQSSCWRRMNKKLLIYKSHGSLVEQSMPPNKLENINHSLGGGMDLLLPANIQNYQTKIYISPI